MTTISPTTFSAISLGLDESLRKLGLAKGVAKDGLINDTEFKNMSYSDQQKYMKWLADSATKSGVTDKDRNALLKEYAARRDSKELKPPPKYNISGAAGANIEALQNRMIALSKQIGPDTSPSRIMQIGVEMNRLAAAISSIVSASKTINQSVGGVSI
ncbi:MAG: hypothetical protein ACK5NY_10920 [Burkholderiaceae bacterium]